MSTWKNITHSKNEKTFGEETQLIWRASEGEICYFLIYWHRYLDLGINQGFNGNL